MRGTSVRNSPTPATRLLTEVTRAFANERGRQPSTQEVLSVVSLALKGAQSEPISDCPVARIERFTVVINGTETSDRQHTVAMEAVSELADNPFVLGGEVLACLRRAREGNLTVDSLAEDLTDALRALDRRMLNGEDPEEIDQVRVEVRNPAAVAKRGDLVAIPAGAGRWAFAVVLAHNPFGIAWGLFEGRHRLKAYSVMHHPPTHRYSVYTADDPVALGKWRVVWNHEGLLGLFPTDPERYRVDAAERNVAESPSGRVRPLSTREANEVGLTDGSYRPVWDVDELQQALRNQAAQMVG